MSPRRFLVTSVVRHASLERTSGFLRLVDLEARRVSRTVALPESRRRAGDPNPRGGLRGGRGVAVAEGRAVVANAEQVWVFDRSWRPLGALGHPLAGGIHELLPDAEGVWITATSADLLLKLGWDGALLESWEWRRDRELVRALGYRRLPPVDRGRDYRDPRALRWGVPNVGHLNAVSRGEEGLLVSLGRVMAPADYRRRRLAGVAGRLADALGLEPRQKGRPAGPAGARPPAFRGARSAIVRLRRGGGAELLHIAGSASVPSHNAIEVAGHLVYNDSARSRLVARRLGARGAEGRAEVAVELPGEPAFLRGLAHLGGERFLVGNQAPPALYRVDLGEGRVVDRLELGGEPGESVFGLAPLPDAFEDLPETPFAEIRHVETSGG